MLKRLKKGICFLILVTSSYCALAQEDLSAAEGQTLITADSLASGNYKNILSSFYQLAVKNLTGPDKALHFTTNPFAIMARKDPSLLKNTNYLKPMNRFWRRLNFDLDAKLDSAFSFNGFSIGARFELLNKRDMSIRTAAEILRKVNSNDQAYHDLLIATRNQVLRQFRDKVIDADQQKALITNLSKAINDSTIGFDNIDPSLQVIIQQVASDSNFTFFTTALANNPHLNFYSERNKGYREAVKQFQNKALWTVGVHDTSYSNGQLFKSMEISTQFLKGFINPEKIFNLELDIKAASNFTDDTLRSGRDLRRLVFQFEPGFNLVLKGKKNRQPYLEFKASLGYTNVWRGNLYPGEKQVTTTANGTLSFRVFDEVWIPLQIKYDPENHNVFGFLSVTTNFQALGKALKGPGK